MNQIRIETPIVVRTTLPEQAGYIAPQTLEEALEILAEKGENAKVYAGGTDLVIDMRLKPLTNKFIVDIKKIKELHTITYKEGEGLTIGATTTIQELLENPIVREKYNLLWESLVDFADQELRHRATIGGNLCNASPAADTPLPLLVYNSIIEIRSKEGAKKVPLKDFFIGVKKTVLKPSELLAYIHIPEPPANAKTMYLKYKRASEDLMVVAIAGLAANIDDPEHRIVRMAYGAVAPRPLLVEEIEEIFRKPGDKKKLIEEAVKKALEKVSPITDVRATREYRLYLVETGTRYMLKKLLEVTT